MKGLSVIFTFALVVAGCSNREGEASGPGVVGPAEAAQAAAGAKSGQGDPEGSGQNGTPASQVKPGAVAGFFVGQSAAEAAVEAKRLAGVEGDPHLGWFSGRGAFAGVPVDIRAAFGPSGIVELDYAFDPIPVGDRLNISIKQDPVLVELTKALGADPEVDVGDEGAWECPGAFFAYASWKIGDANIRLTKEWGCAKGQNRPDYLVFKLRGFSVAWAKAREESMDPTKNPEAAKRQQEAEAQKRAEEAAKLKAMEEEKQLKQKPGDENK